MGAKIMMVAGEPSGDIHCARLAAKITELCPSVTLFGMGGELMAQAGVRLEYDISDSAVMGITEVVGKIPMMLNRLKGLKRLMVDSNPDVIVLVDFPDFNMRLLPFAHSHRIPVVYYIPPKAWAWRKKRAGKIAKYTSAVASIFPFSADVYREAGANAHYVGHPLLDFVRCSSSAEETYRELSLDMDRPIIGLMPGSRIKEIESLLPVVMQSVSLIRAEIPDCQFILPVAHTIPHDTFSDSDPFVKIVDGTQVYNVMNICDLMIIASGTATLEAAYMLTPMIVIYRMSSISWMTMKTLVRLKTSALPNIVAGKTIVPELLQSKVEPRAISRIAVRMIKNPQKLGTQKAELQKVRERLGQPGAVERTAKLVIQFIR
ncbi:lipid-A-disaccharide synthase [Candidatus Poribacteria bacterium]